MLSICFCLYFLRFKAWGQSIPTRPAEDVAFSVARFFQKKGTLLNYYMVGNETSDHFALIRYVLINKFDEIFYLVSWRDQLW